MPILDLPREHPGISILENPLEEKEIDEGLFPQEVFLIEVEPTKYACVNATTNGPDPMTVGLIAIFDSEAEIDIFENRFPNVKGEKIKRTFQEARQIAIEKLTVYGLGLQTNAQTLHIHWVR